MKIRCSYLVYMITLPANDLVCIYIHELLQMLLSVSQLPIDAEL